MAEKIIITYDLDSSDPAIHTALKNELSDIGFTEVYADQNFALRQLPSTTLIHVNVDTAIAEQKFLGACQSLNANWERYVIAEITDPVIKNRR
jgi:hypothetical protein